MEQALGCGLVRCRLQSAKPQWAMIYMIRDQHMLVWITPAADQFLRSGDVWELLSSVCTKMDCIACQRNWQSTGARVSTKYGTDCSNTKMILLQELEVEL